MKGARVIDVAYGFGMLVLATLSTGSLAWASTLSTCGGGDCTWMIQVDGATVMSGMYKSDPDTGDIILVTPLPGTISGDGYTVSLTDMSGNIDPVIGFGVGATNTSTSNKTFAFAFNMAIGGLSGSISTYADLGTSLSAFTSAGGTVYPTSGTLKIMDSQDIRVSPFSSLDKGVDVGDSLSTPSMSTVFAHDTASGSISLDGTYDEMNVIVAFGLTPQTGVGFSGFVSQTVVPEPAALWLVGPALLMLVGIARRRVAA